MSGLDDLADLLAGMRRTAPIPIVRVGSVIGPADDSGYIEVDLGGGETRVIAGDAEEGATVQVEVVGNSARRAAADLAVIAQAAADLAAQAAFGAQQSADGKGRNLYVLAENLDDYEPFTEFDTWYNPADSYRMHGWDGAAWVPKLVGGDAIAPVSIGTAHISELDVGKLVSGLVAANLALVGALRVVGEDGVDQSVLLPGQTVFRGNADLENATIHGELQVNQARGLVGGSLTMESGFTAPGVQPTLANYYPQITLRDDSGAALTNVVGVSRDADSGLWVALRRGPDQIDEWGISIWSWPVSVHDAAGVWLREVALTNMSDGPFGVVALNGRALVGWNYGLGLSSCNMRVVNMTTLAAGSSVIEAETMATRLGQHGNNLLLAYTDKTSKRINDYSITWSGDYPTFTKVTSKVKDLAGLPCRGSFDLGVDTVMMANAGVGTAYTFSTMAESANNRFTLAASGGLTGFGWHGGGFWQAVGAVVSIMDGDQWSGALTRKLYGGVTYFDSQGTQHETAISPIASVDHAKRARLRLTGPSLATPVDVDDIDGVRVYIGAASGTLYRQGNTIGGSSVWVGQSITLSGTVYSLANKAPDFPDQVPFEIKSSDGKIVLRGDGTYKLPAMAGAKMVKTANQTFSAWTWTKIAWDAVEHETATGIADLVAEQLLVPEDGLYLIGLQVSHPANYGSTQYREAAIALGTAATGFIARVGSYNPATTGSPSGQGAIFQPVTTIRHLTAGDILTAWYRSTAGSNFGTLTATDPFNFWLQKIGD